MRCRVAIWCRTRSEKEKVSDQAPGDRYTMTWSSARTTWREPRAAQGDSRQLLSTPMDRKTVRQWVKLVFASSVAVRSPRHWRNCRQLMLTCSCTCFGLTCRYYFEMQRINGTRQKKLETLPTLTGASTDPSSLRRYQQLQLLLTHFWV